MGRGGSLSAKASRAAPKPSLGWGGMRRRAAAWSKAFLRAASAKSATGRAGTGDSPDGDGARLDEDVELVEGVGEDKLGVTAADEQS